MNFLFKKFNNITIKQANIFTTLFIFVFTTIFSTLLIKEKYYDYEVALKQQDIEIEEKEKLIVKRSASQLIKLLNTSFYNQTNIEEIANIFDEQMNFIAIFDKNNKPLYKNKIYKNFSFENLNIKSLEFTNITINNREILLFYIEDNYKIYIGEHTTSQDEIYKQNEKILKNLLIKSTIAIATLAFILFAIVFGFYKVLNSIIQKDTQTFLDFFEQAAYKNKIINSNEIFFKDFTIMVGHANNMLNTINKQKDKLKELNLHLEDKVKEKTKDLENILNAQKEFLKYTVHETNTPLSVILTSIELFVMKNKKDRQLSKIEVAAKNIFNIYDDLSYLVKKEQVAYPKIAINLDLFLQSRLDFFDEVAQLSKLNFKYQSINKKIFIYFNETKLQRVIDNTITNAIKYTLANESVHVELKEVGTFAYLSIGSKSKQIKDTNKIFDEYYREEKQLNGFGLGLRLVRTICDEEDVEISIDSNNELTTFSYRFKTMGE